MNLPLQVLGAGFRAEILHQRRSWGFLLLAAAQAMGFLFLVSMFALTGSRAPTALVDEQPGPITRLLGSALAQCHHSFDLRPMSGTEARAALARGEVAAIVTIPAGLDAALAAGGSASVRLEVDNVNADMTEDLKRALPSAIVSLGAQLRLPGIRLRVDEQDLIGREASYCEYMLVSALALDLFFVAALLGAMPIARETEAGTLRQLQIAPVHPLVPLLGRLLASAAVSTLLLSLPVATVIVGFGLRPLHAGESAGALTLCIVVFTLLGAAAGAWLRGSLAVAGLLGGLALPMYLCSNSLEPQRFDGERIWILAHGSPTYYAVGLLEHAFHGFMVTPEPLLGDAVVLVAWGVAAALIAARGLARSRGAD